MTYEESRTALTDLNNRVRELEANAPRIGKATTEDFVAYSETKAALAKEAKAAGFIRIFDGSYKLNLKAVA